MQRARTPFNWSVVRWSFWVAQAQATAGWATSNRETLKTHAIHTHMAPNINDVSLSPCFHPSVLILRPPPFLPPSLPLPTDSTRDSRKHRIFDKNLRRQHQRCGPDFVPTEQLDWGPRGAGRPKKSSEGCVRTVLHGKPQTKKQNWKQVQPFSA